MNWVVHPENIVRRLASSGLLTAEEAVSDKVKAAAENAAIFLTETWGEDEGFGSSDFTFLLKSTLEDAGYKTDWDEMHCLVVVREDGSHTPARDYSRTVQVTVKEKRP